MCIFSLRRFKFHVLWTIFDITYIWSKVKIKFIKSEVKPWELFGRLPGAYSYNIDFIFAWNVVRKSWILALRIRYGPKLKLNKLIIFYLCIFSLVSFNRFPKMSDFILLWWKELKSPKEEFLSSQHLHAQSQQ